MSESRLKNSFFFDRITYAALLIFLAALTFSTALAEISFVVALVAWILQKSFSKKFPTFDPSVFFPLAAFVALSVVSFFWSEFPRQSFRGIFKILQQFFIFVLVSDCLAEEERQKKSLSVLTGILLVLGADGIWQYVFGRDLIRKIAYEAASSGPRISASFHNYGLLAAYVVSFLPLVYSQLERKISWRMAFLVADVLLGGLLIFWTRLRGAWIAFAGGLASFLWLARKRVYFFVLLLAGIISLFLLPQPMIIHKDIEGKEQSLVERFYLWDRAVQVIKARPWTGTGINTYAVAHQKYDQRESWRVKNYYAHNGYLQIAAETGLPSLACFLAFLFFYFKNALDLLRKMENDLVRVRLVGILTGMVGFLILGVIDTIFHNPQSVMGFWFLAGWGIAYQKAVISKNPV